MVRKVAAICGVAAPLIALATLLVSLAKSPWFSWTESHLSVLGILGSAVGLFNSGLILTGVLGIIFAIGLGRSLFCSRLGRLGSGSFILGSMAISAMGIFPRTIRLPHNLASIAFFAFTMTALLLFGAAAIAAARVRWGILSLLAGMLIAIFLLVPWPWSGGAIPQLLCCLPGSLWMIVFGVVLLWRKSPVDV